MEEMTYTKDELKNSDRFKRFTDAIDALLEEDKEYSISEAESIIVNYMKGCVR